MSDTLLEQGLIDRIKAVKLLILDVDGVMTDGTIVYNDSGEETKVFDVRDGHGIKMLMRSGIETAIITSRKSAVVKHRAKDLGIRLCYQGAVEKTTAFDEILKLTPARPDEMAFIGDDLVDIPVLKRVGLAVAVADAVPEVIERAHYVAKRSGGRGAVREVVELILKTQGKWQDAIKRYL